MGKNVVPDVAAGVPAPRVSICIFEEVTNLSSMWLSETNIPKPW